MQWEYTHVQSSTNNIQGLLDESNRLGALGWEVVGITSADRTVGLNTNVLILKRPIVSLAAPVSDEEWQRDPTGRFDKRRWDAMERAWTAQTAMMEAKTTHIDPPRLPPPPGSPGR